MEEFESAAEPKVEKFGEISRGDATSRIEKTADDVAQGSKVRMETMMSDVINRAPDSHPQPRKDQVDDWKSVIGDVETLTQRFQGMAKMQSMGENRAILEMLRWNKKMEKFNAS